MNLSSVYVQCALNSSYKIFHSFGTPTKNQSKFRLPFEENHYRMLDWKLNIYLGSLFNQTNDSFEAVAV